jgi:hypothetical protein
MGIPITPDLEEEWKLATLCQQLYGKSDCYGKRYQIPTVDELLKARQK